MLKEETKIELRKTIEEKLKSVPEGQRIHLEKDLLEELLFKSIKIERNDSTAKLPIWSGDFLRKIDLSEVSFEDVSWSILDQVDGNNYNLPWKSFVGSKNTITTTEYQIIEGRNKINYSNTNAKIDFKSSWEYKNIGQSSFYLCNFSGTNLSNNDIDEVALIMDCNFSNTGIWLTRQEFPVYRTSFSDNDLSNLEVKVDYNFLSKKIDLSNTRTNINYDINDIIKNADIFWDNESEEQKELYILKEINETIKEGFWDGCFVNGKLFFSDEDKKGVYEQYIQGIVQSTIGSIDEQIGRMKR